MKSVELIEIKKKKIVYKNLLLTNMMTMMNFITKSVVVREKSEGNFFLKLWKAIDRNQELGLFLYCKPPRRVHVCKSKLHKFRSNLIDRRECESQSKSHLLTPSFLAPMARVVREQSFIFHPCHVTKRFL
jgi:hypothetical protein